MAVEYPDWLQDLHVRRPDENAGRHIARIVRGLQGISLTHERERLEALFLANETAERAALVASMRTNCATTAIAVICLAGAPPELRRLLSPRQIGDAMTVLREDCSRARLPGSQWQRLRPGWLMAYWSGNGNNAHVEWCLQEPDAQGVAFHGGGGRSDNAITIDRGDIRWSWGRPLQEIYDPELLADNPATLDNPY